MVVNPYAAAVAPNPFQPAPPTPPPPAADSFAAQLSAAVSDSLAKLGVNPGQVNITITKPAAASPTQIVITYNAAATPATQPAPPAPNPAPAPAPQQQPPASPTAWSPWDGPHDRRDEIPAGGGQVTASGAPDIRLNTKPAGNQYGYAGPAASNPYFTTPSNPLRDGYVLGFQNWFFQPMITGSKNGPVPANKFFYATEEGAKEALRLVRQFEPSAEIDHAANWGGGPFASNVPMYYISLPGGRLLTAGGILAAYYNHGYGVTTTSDGDLQRLIRMA